MQSSYVYILGTVGGGPPKTYVGWTNDLAGRLSAHNGGKGAKSTRGRQWKILYAERFSERRKAMSREWHLKRDRKLRRELLKNLD